MFKFSFLFSFYFALPFSLCAFLSCHSLPKEGEQSRRLRDTSNFSEPLPKEDIERSFPEIRFPEQGVELESQASWKKEGGKRKKLSNRSSNSLGQIIDLGLSGRELVREEFRRKGKRIVRITLRGNIKLYHNQILIRAQSIQIENQELGTIKGDITIYDPETRVYVYAQNASYERSRERVRLWGKPYIKKDFPKQEKLLLSSESIDYHLRKKHLFLKGGVRAHYGEGNMLAERGKYLSEQKKFVLEGNPVFFSPKAYLVGNILIFEEEKKSFELKGESLLYWRESIALKPSSSSSARREIQGKNNRNEKPKTILTADRLRYFYSGSVEAEGNVLLTQPDLSFQAGYLGLSGKEQGDISARGNIHVIDYKDKMELWAQKLEYKKKAQKLLLEEDAILSFQEEEDSGSEEADSKKEAKPFSRLSAEYIERDFAKKLTKARGRVRLRQKDYRVVAELANFYEDRNLLTMEGDAGVYRNNTFMKAEKIFLYLKEERILLQNNIGASFK